MSNDGAGVLLRRSSDVVLARQAATKAMNGIGATAAKRTKFVTAVSEIARNAIIHGGGGLIRFTATGEGRQRRIVAECIDHGPGIDEIERALSDGYTSKNGLGLGLGGSRRLVDRFDIRSSAESGTVVRLECYSR